ncbi:MAG TPA: M48 family metalloprotease, partial [Devosia sp.]|nr:M48 family metalloprotease [Devosia sp.]
MIRSLQIGLVTMLLAFLAGCSSVMGPGVSVSTTGDNMAPAVTDPGDPEDDMIGARENPRIVASYGGIYSDRPAEIMLAQIVGKLLAAADQPNMRFTVTILDSAEVNAFALPGGYIYVTRGILALANDQSELAAVLAHEIAHVVLKHARARTNRIRTTEIVDKVVTGVFGADPATDQSSNKAKLSLAAFSQAQELAADKEGIVIAGKAGFDPHAAGRFLGAMGRFAQFTSGGADVGDDFLSSHPSTPDRIQKATEHARTFFGAPGLGAQNRAEYMTAVSGILYGDSPEEGAIVGRKFIHPTLKFTFSVPENYDLQMSKGAVVGVAGDGEAVRFDSAEVPPSMSLADYLKSGWIAGLRPETVTTSKQNGFDTASGLAATDQWNFRVEVVRFGGRVYRFIFAARIDSELFARAATSTLKSFRAATNADLRQVRSLAVK